MAKILLVDDDAVLLRLYSTKFMSDGHEVMTASDGTEGIARVQTFKPHIVVLDLLMPKLNGFSFIESLKSRADTKGIPIIVFSSVASQEQIDRLKSLGVEMYLNKVETTPTQLVTAINTLLGGEAPKTG